MVPHIVKVLVAVAAALLAAACEQENGALVQARWHNSQGVGYMDQHNYTRALSEFATAVDLVPDYAIGHANKGIAYYSLGKYDSALVALHTALEHDPELLPALYTTGLIYNAQGRAHDRALEALTQVAARDPDDPHVLYYLGRVKAKLGRHEEAVADLRQAVRLDSFNVSAHYALANEYRRLGREDAWRRSLSTFNELTRAGHKGVSSSYQGQGAYAEAIPDIAAASQPHDDSTVPIVLEAAPAAVDGIPRAVAATDWDADGHVDLVTLDGSLRLWRNGGRGELEPGATVALPAGLNARSLAAADLNNDGYVDFVVGGDSLLVLLADSTGTWRHPVIYPVAGATLGVGDVDHDGDLDMVAGSPDGTGLWFNDGGGSLVPATAAAHLDEANAAHAVLFTDFDSDRDIDILLSGPGGLQLYSNNRDGTLSDVTRRAGLHDAGAAAATVAQDMDGDLDIDLCVLGAAGQLVLWRNDDTGRFVADTPPVETGVGAARGLQAADLDTDGDLDLVAYGEDGLRVLTHRSGAFTPGDPVLPAGTGAAAAAQLDLGNDGRIDLFAAGRLLRNRTEAGNWIAIQLKGEGSNRDGVGARIEVKTAARLQKREVQKPGVVTVGLASSDSLEFVRVLWPSGVRQAELATPANHRMTVAELDRKGTSCPVVFVWDGERYRFVSDVNGGAIVGYLIEPGVYNTPDTDEYLPLGPMAPQDGGYVVKVANVLEEVIFVDGLQLVAVDHPAAVQVLPNERLLTAPPYPEFGLFAVDTVRGLAGAWDGAGNDIRDQLRATDDVWYTGFGLTDIHGYAENHTLVLDLGDLAGIPSPVLVANGWVDYAHSTSNWAAYQRGWALSPPRLEVADGQGGWALVTADMGTPAGLPKDMVVDLAGVFPSDDHRLRITTNTAVYWDQLAVGNRAGVDMAVHRVDCTASDLRWRGYPEHTRINGTFAFRYHYDRLRPEAVWSTHAGSFTRYGAVTELVRRVDDRYVVMSHGDELTTTFAAASLPPLRAGRARSFLLYSDGFGKDMDYHSAYSQTVGPLPYHAMPSYPYPAAAAALPFTEAHAEAMLDYNNRLVRGYY